MRFVLSFALLFVTACSLSTAGFVYPDARRGAVVDDYNGVQVADPYRWLESSDTPEVRDWIEAQNELTFDHLEAIPSRDRIRARMTELWDYERYKTPWQRGGAYFWFHNTGVQAQEVLYTASTPDGEGRVLLDPNTLSEDGTVALSGTYVSDDGKLLAYGVSDGGSDWKDIKVLNVATGEPLTDHIKWVKFSGAAWTADSKGFYYSRYDAPEEGKDLDATNYNQKLYYHQLGTEQSEDVLVYERPDQPRWGFYADTSEDGRYLLIYVWDGTDPKNRLYVRDLADEKGAITPVFDGFDASYDFLGNVGTRWYVKTDRDAPKGRVVSFDLATPEAWTEVIPQTEATLTGANLVGGHLVGSYLVDAHSAVKVFDLDGGLVREVDVPGIGTARGFGGRHDNPETFFSWTSFTTPGTIYRYDVGTGEVSMLRAPATAMDPEAWTTEQAFVDSADGTKVPVFLVHKKGLEKTGALPVYLYGYGGFDISITPYYSTVHRVWLEMGGVLAIATLRGGGEYGKAWHDAGRLKNKQNVFDDFYAVSRWLVDTGYTKPSRIAIGGRSNGGLLVGASITQHPEMCGAALPGVGVLDMLRFNKFTIGWAWESDYGSPQDPEMFQVLRAYSPLHNVTSGTAYPPTLITTADRDDRVVPYHSFKFAAAIQRAHAGPAPVMIRIETRAGHGAGKPTAMRIAEWTDSWAFVADALGMTLPEGF